MRITEISVTRLFGLFDHQIPLHLEERVTLIHGPNDYGKTTLLALVDSFFAGRYSTLRRVPFRDLRFTFDNGQVIEVVRIDARPKPDQRTRTELTVRLFRDDKVEERTKLVPIAPSDLPIPIEHLVPFFSRIAPNEWRDSRTGQVLGFEDAVRVGSPYLPESMIAQVSAVQEAEWLRLFRSSVRVRFIETQRLLRVTKSAGPHADPEPLRPAVLLYSSELAKLIQAKLTEYATLSQSLDRSFPKRLVEQSRTRGKPTTTIDELRRSLQQLEDRRVGLTEAGLLDKEEEPFDLASYLNDPTTQSVLPVYVSDAEQKLDVFSGLAPKIELLKGIVNAHFQFKVITISKEKGFEFSTKYPGSNNKPRPLPPCQHL